MGKGSDLAATYGAIAVGGKGSALALRSIRERRSGSTFETALGRAREGEGGLPMDAERNRYYEAMPREGHYVGRCEMLLPDELAGKRVLDLGCRRGKGACKIADRVGTDGAVLGVDPSAACIEAARAYVAEHAARRSQVAGAIDPTFACAPFEDLRKAGVEDASVDMAFVNSVLNLAWDRDAALREIVRVLMPGGVLHHAAVFAEEPLPEEEARVFAAAGNVFGAAWSTAEFEAAARRAGFVRCEFGESSAVEPDGDDAVPALVGRRFAAVVVRAHVR